MKKILSFVACAVLASSMSVLAADINVNAGDTLDVIISGALEGDVVILADGAYNAGEKGKTIKINKSVTLKAATPGGATLSKYQFVVEAEAVIDHVTIDGIVSKYDKDTDGKYFFQANTGNAAIGTLTFKDCVVEGYGRGVLRSTTAIDEAAGKPGDKIDNIRIENCTFINNSCANAGYAQINTQRVFSKTITIKNSTFYESKASVLRYEAANDVAVSMENCSVIKCGSTGSRNMVEVGGSVGANATFSIKNCIFTGTFDTAPDKPINLQNKGTIENTLLEGFASGDLAIKSVINSPVEATVSAYDFAARTINTDPTTVSGIGDKRWSLNGNTGSNNLANIADSKNIVSTEYFDIAGRQVSQHSTGIVIEKRLFDNGTVEMVKTIR